MDQLSKQKERKEQKQYSAQQKAQAVLAVWTERRKPLEICRELGIGWTILNQWQKRAMEGMLQALEPHVKLDRKALLSPRLQSLLQGKLQETVESKLAKRLARDVKQETENVRS